MKRRISKIKPVGERIAEALRELHEALRSGRPLHEQFTVRTIEIASPKAYRAAEVRRTRARLAVSQAVFARLIGVSAELVQHWEQGITAPRPLARRLMDEINRDPAGFLARHVAPSESRRKAAG
jgi:DNA-binding transcriptional regulator YiaG